MKLHCGWLNCLSTPGAVDTPRIAFEYREVATLREAVAHYVATRGFLPGARFAVWEGVTLHSARLLYWWIGREVKVLR